MRGGSAETRDGEPAASERVVSTAADDVTTRSQSNQRQNGGAGKGKDGPRKRPREIQDGKCRNQKSLQSLTKFNPLIQCNF